MEREHTERELNSTGQIHETLNQQVDGRPELTPPRELEMDRDYAESLPTTLAIDFNNLQKKLNESVAELEAIDWKAWLEAYKSLQTTEEYKELGCIIKERVQRETNLFHDYNEIRQAADQISGLIINEPSDDYSTRSPNDNKLSNNNKNIAAYRPLDIEVDFKKIAPRPVDEVRSYLFEGLPDRYSMILNHELTHAVQFHGYDYKSGLLLRAAKDEIKLSGHNKGQLLKLIVPAVCKIVMASVLYPIERVQLTKSPIDLLEAHAFQEGPREDHDIVELAQKLVDEYKIKNIDRINAGIRLTKQLLALNIPKAEIGELIRVRGVWDPKTARFSQMEDFISDRLSKLHLTEDDLDNIIIAERLEKEIQRNKAMTIAREETIKYKIRHIDIKKLQQG